MGNGDSSFDQPKFEVEAMALIRTPSDDEWSGSFLHSRPYCEDCKSLKGSKTKNRYFPTRACLSCGSVKTIVKGVDGIPISWDKWVLLKKKTVLAKMGITRKDHGEYYLKFLQT